MITEVKGDIFRSRMAVLTCPVNLCGGVLGAGLALAFKQKYQGLVEEHRAACSAGLLGIGKLTVVWPPGPPGILLFPTKDHWKNPSKMAYVEKGLFDLRARYKELAIESLALPMLGCGLGGLPREQVRGLTLKTLGDLPIEMELYA